jgi:hypothetical protein
MEGGDDHPPKLGRKESRGSEMPENVCPYFGKNEDLCDVGCGYISTHDVNMIIKYCSSSFCNCMKYQELCDRKKQLIAVYAECN